MGWSYAVCEETRLVPCPALVPSGKALPSEEVHVPPSPRGAQEAGPNPTGPHLPGSRSWLKESYSSLGLFAGQAVCVELYNKSLLLLNWPGDSQRQSYRAFFMFWMIYPCFTCPPLLCEVRFGHSSSVPCTGFKAQQFQIMPQFAPIVFFANTWLKSVAFAQGS